LPIDISEILPIHDTSATSSYQPIHISMPIQEA